MSEIVTKAVGKKGAIVMRQTFEEWKRQVFRKSIIGYGKRYKFGGPAYKSEENDTFGKYIIMTSDDGKKYKVRIRRKSEWENELERVSNNW